MDSFRIHYPMEYAKREMRLVQCLGFEREPFEQLLQMKGWLAERSHCTSLIISDQRIQSPQCHGYFETFYKRRDICYACSMSRRALNNCRNATKRPLISSGKLRSISNRTNGNDARELKVLHAELIKERQISHLMEMQYASLERELNQYRPKDHELRNFVKAAVKYMNENELKLSNPVCQWTINGYICGQELPSYEFLLGHVISKHISVPVVPSEPCQDCYDCQLKTICNNSAFKLPPINIFSRPLDMNVENTPSYDPDIWNSFMYSDQQIAEQQDINLYGHLDNTGFAIEAQLYQ